MSRYSIGMVGYGRNSHSACFEDFARAMADALRALGHEYVQSFDPKPGRLIMFGANNIHDPTDEMPADAIVYNSEQLAAFTNPKKLMQNYEQFRGHVVWDYSESNIVRLKELGIERAVLCPVGYVPSMTKSWADDENEQDIDVLFYGSMNAERREILDALDESGLKVERLYDVYGERRDKFIARSKVVLNLHFYRPAVFEIFRVSHLLANKKCVVTEDGGQDRKLESFAAMATHMGDRASLVARCKMLAANEKLRRSVAQKGFELFSKISLVDNVRTALEQS